MKTLIVLLLIGYSCLSTVIFARQAIKMCPCPINEGLSETVPLIPNPRPSCQRLHETGLGNETEIKIVQDLIVHFGVFKSYLRYVIIGHELKNADPIFKLAALKQCMPSDSPFGLINYSNEIQRNGVYKEIYTNLHTIKIFVDKLQQEVLTETRPVFDPVHYRFVYQSLQSEMSYCSLKDLVDITSNEKDELKFNTMILERDLDWQSCGNDWSCTDYKCKDKELAVMKRVETLIEKSLNGLRAICINISAGFTNGLCGKLASLRF